MKKALALLLVVVLAISALLVGCGAKTETKGTPKSEATKEQAKEAPKTQAPAKKAVLRIMWWGSQDRHDRTLKVIDMYQKNNPGITLEPEFTSWDGYWEKIAAQAAANNLPDIFQQDYQYLKQYVDKGLLLNLNDFVKDNRLDLRDAAENSYSGGVVKGGLYAVNLGTNALNIAYDPELFKKAGVPEPQPGWTWDDYMDTAAKLHKALGIYADGNFPGGYFHGLKHYLRQHGEVFYAEDGTKLGYEDDKYFIEFFEKELQLVKAGVLPKPDVRLEIKSVENELIVTQKAAMLSAMHSNQIVAMTKAANRPLKLALLPTAKGEKKPGHYLKPSQFFSVAKSSKNADEAVKFINYFTNDIEANKVLLAERGVPISSKVREALKPLLSDSQKVMFDYIDLVIKNSSPIDPPDPAGHPEVDKLLKNIEQEILYEKITVEEAAKKFRQGANEILAKNKK